MVIAVSSTGGGRARSRPVRPAAASDATTRASARAAARAGRVHRDVRGERTDGAGGRDVEAWARAVAAAATGAAAAAASAATSRRIDRYHGRWGERIRAPNGGWCRGVEGGGKGHRRDVFLGVFKELAADHHVRTGGRRAGDRGVARCVGFGGDGGRDVCHDG